MVFSEAIAPFVPVTARQAEVKISSEDKFILFIGRGSCPYCQRFAPKLNRVASENGLTVHFLNSEDSKDLAAIQVLRQRYQVPTVPGLLVAKKGQVRVVCDSSLSEEAILDFIG